MIRNIKAVKVTRRMVRVWHDIMTDPMNDSAPSECVADIGRYADRKAREVAQGAGYKTVDEIRDHLRSAGIEERWIYDHLGMFD